MKLMKQVPSAKLPAKPVSALLIVGVGASAGGLEAFTQLLHSLPGDSGMAFVIIQHLDPNHESMLTDLLSKATMMTVREAQDGMHVDPNCAYVIPPNMYLTLADGALSLRPRSEGGGPHMPIDIFFRSLAETQTDRAVGVILSGAGSDGALGLEAIHSQGGMSLVQDPLSAKFDGMPRSAIATGCVDFVLNPEGIAKELVRIVHDPYIKGASMDTATATAEGEELGNIFAVLRNQKGIDFNHYKRSTIQRRIQRRMLLQKIQNPGEYAAYLKDHTAEVDNLHNDLLIQVTRFFRDPETFEFLKEKIFTDILRQKAPEDPFRFWVAGCASGEEVYSLAIGLLEFLGDKASHVPIQMFGTDISDSALDKARAGIYLQNIEIDVSAERLKRFFNKTGGRYQINKSVRDLCVFAKQNILRDPPFSKLDLISCRNVLIYMEPVLQKKILSIFHFALNTPGWLMVGSSENPGLASGLFSATDKKQRIFSKKLSTSKQIFDFTIGPHTIDSGDRRTPPKLGLGTPNVHNEADRVLLGHYVPAGVIVNENLEVLEFRGDTHLYLHNAPGEASLQLLRLAREGIAAELAGAFRKGKEAPFRKTGLHVEQGGRLREVTIEVIPLKVPLSRERYWAVTFESASSVESDPKGLAAARHKKGRKAAKSPGGLWKQKLAAAQAHLQLVIEEKGVAIEEMQAANEEVLSSNEELQSMNEEMQTAKEELQATNEELTTVNEQLRRSNLETLSQMNDLNNFVDSTRVPIITVGSDLRIRRFTPQAEKMLNLIPTDVGRMISDITPRINVSDLEKRIREAIENVVVQEQNVQDKEGHWYSLRIHPYVTVDKKIDGAVIVLMDVDILKRSEIAIEEAKGKIQQLNVELEERVQKRTQELSFANKELETFNYSVSHDLRAPLRAINAFAEILSEKYGGQLDAAGKDTFHKIHSATQRMAQLIDDILSLSQLDHKELHTGSVDLSRCAQGIADELQKSQPERRVRFVIAPGLTAMGDENLIRIALTNLLNNAWKFTSKHPAGTITFGREEKDGAPAYFVRDDGAGFDMAHTKDLFGVFQRLHSTDEFPGTGIGLATVQRIILRHGGRIWAEATPEQGATFYFTLTR